MNIKSLVVLCNLMRGKHQRTSRSVALLLLTMLIGGSGAMAQLPVPASTQFDITGYLQEASLDPSCAANAHCGGTLKVNGHLVSVPKETVVIFPANALTWQEIFKQAPAPWGIPGNPGVTSSVPTTGMAVADCAVALVNGACPNPPLTNYEVHVVGNRVLPDANHPTDQYIAGLIDISQEGLNGGAGFINFIDYSLGEMRVGGTIGSNTTGTRVRINDPSGRYGRATTSPDIRFTVDPDNPTIMAGSGYPMCLPRSAPDSDGLCPEGNRPKDVNGNFVASFNTNNVTNPNFQQLPGVFPDSTKQAPFEVGDFVTFSGTLVQDCPTCAGGGSTVGPLVGGAAATWVAAHTIVNNVAIYTFPGSDPAYVSTEVTLIGTGGLTVLGAGEASVRTRFEGMMTDPSRSVHLYGIDYNRTTGAVTDRDWGTIGVDPGAPVGAVKGRWRFRPPCLASGSTPTSPDKQCVYGPSGTFLPPPREMRAVIYDPATGAMSNPGMTATAANGIIYGQYHAPILEYIFPENIPGSPIVENNFNAIDFLTQGGYTSSGGTLVGQLNPWPSNIVPSLKGCTSPSVTSLTFAPNPVPAGSVVTLTALVGGSGPFTYSWSQAATDPVLVAITPGADGTATFTAPVSPISITLNFAVKVTGQCVPTASLGVQVPVSVALAPSVSYTPTTPVFSVASGTPVTIVATGSDPQGLKLKFTWTQVNAGSPGVPTVVNPNPLVCPLGSTSCSLSFTYSIPQGGTATTIQVAAAAINEAGVSSAPDYTWVTINPPSDAVAITSAEFRTSKQRLILAASSSIVSSNIAFTLQPYVTSTGATYDPCTGVGCTFVNNGGGLYSIDLVGAPPPACNPGGAYATPCSAKPLQVVSSAGGVSPFTALTKIRQ